MKLLLIRHGESVDDLLDCFGGAADWALSEAGKEDAAKLANILKSEPIDHIYSSPMKRAKETAEAINALQQVGMTEIFDLRERNSFGVMSGINKKLAKDIFGYMLTEFKHKPGDYYSKELVLGAEPHEEFDLRMKEALATVVKDAQAKGYQTVVAVTHGNATRSIYKNILNYESKIDLDHLAKSVIEYQDGNFKLISNEGIYHKEAAQVL